MEISRRCRDLRNDTMESVTVQKVDIKLDQTQTLPVSNSIWSLITYFQRHQEVAVMKSQVP
jgi:hypothetical protein